MNRTLNLVVICAILLAGLLVVSANNRMNPAVENLVENETSEALPPQLYVSNCARCHGGDGKGDTQLGRESNIPDLTVTAKKMSLTRVKNIISNGHDDMPAFGKQLKAAQIASLAKYVRSLK